LEYNKKRDREKLVLQNTTKEELDKLLKITGLSIYVKKLINAILEQPT
jgi:hypothetical protein